MINQNSQGEDKIDILMSKVSQFETALKEERKTRFKIEEELKNYKTISIPNYQKQLEDKEGLLKATFVDKIKIEKELINREKNVYF
jgi:hypothetical protein